MGVRQKFTKVERVAFNALPIGAAVMWRNGGHWWPGEKSGPIGEDSIGMQRFMLINLATTRTISRGQAISGYPGNVRVPGEGEQCGTGSGYADVVVRDGKWVRATG